MKQGKNNQSKKSLYQSSVKVQEPRDENDKGSVFKQLKKNIGKIDPIILMRTFSDNRTCISPLKVEQYQKLMQIEPNLMIPALPLLPKIKSYFNSTQDKLPFISFKCLSQFSFEASKTQQSSFQKLSGTQDKEENELNQQNFNTYLLKHNREQIKKLQVSVIKQQKQILEECYDNIMKKELIQNKSKAKLIPQKIDELGEIELNERQQHEEIKKKELNKKIESDNLQNQTKDNQQKDFYVCWLQQNQFHLKPNMRESATMQQFQDKLYLFGGFGTTYFGTIWEMSLQLVTLQWTEIPMPQSLQFQYQRFGHTQCLFRKNLIIFGGQYQRPGEKKRENLNDLQLFNIENQKWTTLCNSQTQGISQRRNHSAVMVGKHMIVFGGIEQKSKYLNDGWIFDLVNYRWSQADIDLGNCYSQGVAFHAALAIYHPSKKQQKLYQPEEIKTFDNFDKRSIYANEGVYFFGGLDQNDIMENKIYVLTFDTRPMTFSTLEVKGIAPLPRYGHTMNFLERNGMIVIFGGRNNSGFLCNLFDFQITLSADINILRLEYQTWINVKLINNLKINRAFHCAAHMNQKLYVFGGYGEKGFVSGDIHILDLDQSKMKEANADYIIQKQELMRMTKRQTILLQ